MCLPPGRYFVISCLGIGKTFFLVYEFILFWRPAFISLVFGFDFLFRSCLFFFQQLLFVFCLGSFLCFTLFFVLCMCEILVLVLETATFCKFVTNCISDLILLHAYIHTYVVYSCAFAVAFSLFAFLVNSSVGVSISPGRGPRAIYSSQGKGR